jgi:hypothetical protein
MKVKTVVTCYAGGVKNVIAETEIVEITAEEYTQGLDGLQSLIGSTSYMEVGGVVIPGDFIRANCVVELREMFDGPTWG